MSKIPFEYLGDQDKDPYEQRHTRLARLFRMEAEAQNIPLLGMLPEKIARDIFMREETSILSRSGFRNGANPDHYMTFDVHASFVAAMCRPMPAHGLSPTHGYQLVAGSFWLCETPEWKDTKIRHPGGFSARPGELQWYTHRTLRLMQKFCGTVKVIRGYVPSTLDKKYPRQTITFARTANRIMSERRKFPKGTPEYNEIKDVYSVGLSSIRNKANTDTYCSYSGQYGTRKGLLRPDIVRTIQEESAANLWEKSLSAITRLDRELVSMTTHDEVTFAGNFQTWPTNWFLGQDIPGSMRIKEVA